MRIAGFIRYDGRRFVTRESSSYGSHRGVDPACRFVTTCGLRFARSVALLSRLSLRSPSILPHTREPALSIQNALQTWKQLAENNVELAEVKARITQLESLVEAARNDFDETLDELNPTDRDAIFSIMSVYEQHEPSDDELHWLVNKIGNEGVEGIAWPTLFAGWQQRYPEHSRVDLGLVLRRHQRYVVGLEEGSQEIYRLTPEGQTLFLNG